MNNNFEEIIQKKILIADRKKSKFEKIQSIRALFLFLNREKYLQFSFDRENMRFWKIATAKSSEFKKDLNEEITLIETKSEMSEQDKELVKYYNIVLKTLEKYDKNYGKTIGLILNRIFCRNISLYIRNFI